MTLGSEIIRVNATASADEWDEVYRACAGAMPTQSSAWASAIVVSGGYRNVSRFYEFADGCRAVMPLFAGRFPPGSLAMQYSPPAAWGFGGPIATAPLSAAHIGSLLEDLARQPALMTRIRPNPLAASIWREAAPAGWTRVPRIAHVLDISGGFEHVWTRQFRQDTRNRIRRAERAGVEISCGADARIIAEFHQLLRHSFERWGRQQGEPTALARWRGLRRDPEAKFHAMAASAGPIFRIWMARLDGKPVAATLVLRDREAHYTRGAMDEDLAGKTYANYLLHSRAIEDACREGCSNYHMGETGCSVSLAQFKSRFGATPRPYAEYHFERLPISRVDQFARSLVKRAIGFRDA